MSALVSSSRASIHDPPCEQVLGRPVVVGTVPRHGWDLVLDFVIVICLGVGLVWVLVCPVIIIVPLRSGAHHCLLCGGLNG